MPTTSRFIGALAKQVGMTAKTIRYYEGLGLLGQAQRSEGGYRCYGEADLARLRFIQGAKALGLSLAEIKAVISLWGAGEKPCHHVTELLAEKLAAVDARIAELQRFRGELASVLNSAEGDSEEATEPCRHIAGAARGDWALHPPEAILHPHPVAPSPTKPKRRAAAR